MQIRSVEKFLHAVKIRVDSLHEAERRIADRLAPNFNLFDFLQRDENAISRCLACLLDPQETHGQGAKFLSAFIKYLSLPTRTTPNWLHGIPQRVQVEKATDRIENNMRRIDICIEWPDGVLGIENKPWAIDQDQQLADYAIQLQRTASRKGSENQWLLIYLSDQQPDERSLPVAEKERYSKSGNYLEINYQTLCDWLDECAKECKAAVVRIFIEELAKYIRSNVMGLLDNSVENEVVDLILSDANLETAFLISKSFHAVQTRLLEDFFNDLRKGLAASQRSLSIPNENKLLDAAQKISYFDITGNIPEQKKFLSFEFNGYDNNFFWGIKRGYGVPRDETWEAINSLMQSSMKREGKLYDTWPWYADADPAQEFDGIDVLAWSHSVETWQAMRDGRLAKAFVKLADRVYGEVFKDKEELLR